MLIERAGEIMGMLSVYDLMVLQCTSLGLLYLVREIVPQNRMENIYELSLKNYSVVRPLIYEGTKPNFFLSLT